MCALATLLHGMSPITGIVAHNRRGYGRLSLITEAPSASSSDRKLAKRAQRLLPRGWRLLSEPSYCRHRPKPNIRVTRGNKEMRETQPLVPRWYCPVPRSVCGCRSVREPHRTRPVVGLHPGCPAEQSPAWRASQWGRHWLGVPSPGAVIISKSKGPVRTDVPIHEGREGAEILGR